MIASLLTLLIVGIVAIFVVSVVFAIVGAFVSLAMLLLFKVLPILIVGYVALRLLAPRKKKLSTADQRWLES